MHDCLTCMIDGVRADLNKQLVADRSWSSSAVDFHVKSLGVNNSDQQKEVDHNKPYPFPGHDITQENIRDHVPFEGGNIAKDVWLQFTAAVVEERDCRFSPRSRHPRAVCYVELWAVRHVLR